MTLCDGILPYYDPRSGYKLSDFYINGTWYIGCVHPGGSYVITKVVWANGAGTVTYAIGSSGYTAGAGFQAWAAGLSYDTFENTF